MFGAFTCWRPPSTVPTGGAIHHRHARDLDGSGTTFLNFMVAQGTVTMILLAFAGSVLAGNDHSRGGLIFYLSRRINVVHYAAGKLLAIGLIISLTTTLPALVLFIEYGLLGDTGTYFGEKYPIFFGILGYGALLSLAVGLLLFALVSWMPACAAGDAVGRVVCFSFSAVFLLCDARAGNASPGCAGGVAVEAARFLEQPPSWEQFSGGQTVVPGAAVVVCAVCIISAVAIVVRLRRCGINHDHRGTAPPQPAHPRGGKCLEVVWAADGAERHQHRDWPGHHRPYRAERRGKTTLLKLLTGQSKPNIGGVQIYGHDAWLAKAKAHVGFCPYGDATWDELSGRKLVAVTAGLHGFTGDEAKRRTEAVLETVGMADRAERPVRTYSKGMRQRIKLGQALIHDPDLLVLDEPLNGVDPVGREELNELFLRLAKAGKAVLISSHILNEMDELANHILFVCRGKLLASGSLETIREVLDDYPLKVRVSCESPRQFAPQLMALESVKSVSVEPPEDLFLEVQNPNRFYAEFGELATTHDIGLNRLKSTDTSAEAVFDYLMERAARPE